MRFQCTQQVNSSEESCAQQCSQLASCQVGLAARVTLPRADCAWHWVSYFLRIDLQASKYDFRTWTTAAASSSSSTTTNLSGIVLRVTVAVCDSL
jgi:hypothetical protein